MNRRDPIQRNIFDMAYTVALTQPVVGWILGLTALVSTVVAVLA